MDFPWQCRLHISTGGEPNLRTLVTLPYQKPKGLQNPDLLAFLALFWPSLEKGCPAVSLCLAASFRVHKASSMVLRLQGFYKLEHPTSE